MTSEEKKEIESVSDILRQFYRKLVEFAGENKASYHLEHCADRLDRIVKSDKERE